jgi:hypothetical protein
MNDGTQHQTGRRRRSAGGPKYRLRLTFHCGLILALAGVVARAETLVTHYFEGVVNYSTSDFVQVGDRITGTFTYDLDWDDASPSNPNSFFYFFPPGWALEEFPVGSPIGMSYSVGSLSHRAQEYVELVIDDDPDGDMLFLSSDVLMGPSGPCCIGGYIELVDPTGAAFPSDRPPARLDLAAFASKTFWGTDGQRDFLAAIDVLHRVTRVPVRTIALSGQPAPDGNGTLSSFDDHPPMRLNEAGQIAFAARLTGTSGGNTDNAGIFRGDGGPITQITRFPYSPFQRFFLNTAGEIAFTATANTVAPPGAESVRGVFRYDGQTLTEIVREGQPLPGGDGAFSPDLGAYGISDSGQVVFGAGWGILDHRILVGDGSSITELFRRGQPAPDGRGTLADILSWVEFNQAGRLFIHAYIEGTSVWLDRGLFVHDGTLLHQVARLDQSAPDGDGIFAAFPLPSDTRLLNVSGQLAFPVELAGATSAHSRIYRADTSGLTEIARQGQPAPDGNGVFTGFELPPPVLNTAGQAAFVATLPGVNIDFGPHRGLYVHDGNQVTQIVRSGQPGLGGHGKVYHPGDFALNDLGQVAFSPIDFDDGNYSAGIYFFDGKVVKELAREGDLFDLGDGDLRVIEGLFIHALNNPGQLAFSIRFTDGTSGVFVASAALESPSGPRLQIEITDPDLILRWEEEEEGSFAVEFATSLGSPGNWRPIDTERSSTTLPGGRRLVSAKVALTGSAGFFRLRR